MNLPLDLPIIKQTTEGIEQRYINARNLWHFLESKQHFSDWIKNAIEAGQFKENKDYFTFHKIMKRKKGERGASKMKDYLLTLSTAKELTMLERNTQGKMLNSVLLGMNAEQWKQAHGIKGDLRKHYNAEQLAKLEYLERADEMLLDLNHYNFSQRKTKLAEMLLHRFSE